MLKVTKVPLIKKHSLRKGCFCLDKLFVRTARNELSIFNFILEPTRPTSFKVGKRVPKKRSFFLKKLSTPLTRPLKEHAYMVYNDAAQTFDRHFRPGILRFTAGTHEHARVWFDAGGTRTRAGPCISTPPHAGRAV